jgi:hypothetical protein
MESPQMKRSWQQAWLLSHASPQSATLFEGGGTVLPSMALDDEVTASKSRMVPAALHDELKAS